MAEPHWICSSIKVLIDVPFWPRSGSLSSVTYTFMQMYPSIESRPTMLFMIWGVSVTPSDAKWLTKRL